MPLTDKQIESLTDFGLNTLSSGIGGLANLGFGIIGANHNAALNFHYNELAAQNADKRTRALYGDYLSPSARIRQLKEAGLSPSLFADGAGGGAMGMTQGAAGGGASGVGLPTGLMTPESLAQVELMKSEVRKNDAETSNIDTDTDIKEIEKNVNKMKATRYKNEYNMTMCAVMKNGKPMSMFEFAKGFNNYHTFTEHVRSAMTLAGDNEALNSFNSADGQEIARSIFLNAHQFDTQMEVFKADKVNASFMRKVTDAMNTEDFASMNARAALKNLESAAESAELTASQRKAWNDVIGRLRNYNSTVADIVIVVSMILNNAMSNYNMPHFNSTTNNYTNNNNNYNNNKK